MSEFTGIHTPIPPLRLTGLPFTRNNLFFQFLTETDAPSLDEFLEASPVHPVEDVSYRLLDDDVFYKYEIF